MDVHVPRAITDGLRLRRVDVLTAQLSVATGATWRYVRINQAEFVATARTLQELVNGIP